MYPTNTCFMQMHCHLIIYIEEKRELMDTQWKSFLTLGISFILIMTLKNEFVFFFLLKWSKYEFFQSVFPFLASFKNFFLKFIYFWERERETEHEQGRGTERGRYSIWSNSRLWAVGPEPNSGLKSTHREIMTWATVGRLAYWDFFWKHWCLGKSMHIPT